MSAENEARLVAKAGFEVLSLEVKVTLRKLTRKAAVTQWWCGKLRLSWS